MSCASQVNFPLRVEACVSWGPLTVVIGPLGGVGISGWGGVRWGGVEWGGVGWSRVE